jgi:hypothetical protein
VSWEGVIATYAAIVSTVSVAVTIIRGLPSIRISVTRQAHLVRQGKTIPVLSVRVTNAGREPVEVLGLAYLCSNPYFNIPPPWVSQLPFTLRPGESKELLHPEDGTIPEDAAFIARDAVGRWWPRRRRLRVRLRRLQSQWRNRRAR